MNKTVTIIIPCKNEQENILTVLESVKNFDYPKDLIEVFIVDGLSSDNTVEIVKDFIKDYSNFFLFENEKKTVPFALNIAISKSKSDYIIRLDAHSEFPRNYITKLIYWHEKLNADNVGGICITEVLNKNKKSNSIKKVLQNKFGVGNSLFRIGTENVKEVDTVPFGCFKRDCFEKYGLYNEKLTRNQDIELNRRIKKRGGRIYLIPEIKCIYFARENFDEFALNNYSNGLWNIFTIYITRNIFYLSLRHFIPLLFLLSLISTFVLGIISKYMLVLFTFIFLTYNIFILIQVLKIHNKDTSKFYLFWAFYTLHFSYGFGSIIGIFKGIKYLYIKS